MVRWLAVLTLVLLTSACGADVISGTAGRSTNGLETRTAPQVREAAIDALKAAGSVHITGTAIDDSGQKGRFDLRIQGTSYTGTITASGADLAVTAIGDTQYFKTDAAGWAALGAPDAAPYFAGKWVKAPAVAAGTDERFTLDMLVVGIRQDEIGMRPGVAQTTLNDTKAVVVTYANGDRLYVANTGAAHPLRITSSVTGDLEFSEHGTDFHITAPPDAVDGTQPLNIGHQI